MPNPTNKELTERHTQTQDETQEMVDLKEWVRNATSRLAVALNGKLPDSREKSLALTALQEVSLWSRESIAIHGLPEESE
jgi:hypothetical protein